MKIKPDRSTAFKLKVYPATHSKNELGFAHVEMPSGLPNHPIGQCDLGPHEAISSRCNPPSHGN